jgi:hypothetical protein
MIREGDAAMFVEFPELASVAAATIDMGDGNLIVVGRAYADVLQQPAELWHGLTEDLMVGIYPESGEWYQTSIAADGAYTIRNLDNSDAYFVPNLRAISLEEGIAIDLQIGEAQGDVGIDLSATSEYGWENTLSFIIRFSNLGQIYVAAYEGNRFPDRPWIASREASLPGRLPQDKEIQIQIAQDADSTRLVFLDTSGEELGSFGPIDAAMFPHDTVVVRTSNGPNSILEIRKLQAVRPDRIRELRTFAGLNVDGSWRLLPARQERDSSWWVNEDSEWIQLISADGTLKLTTSQTTYSVDLVMLDQALGFTPPEVSSLLETLGQGYTAHLSGGWFTISQGGNVFLRIPKTGLNAGSLPNGERVFVGVEPLASTLSDLEFPEGYILAIDQHGYLSILSEGRVAGIFFEGEFVTMPGLDRLAANQVQVTVSGGVPTVTSLRGTALFKYEGGEWLPMIDPQEETPFVLAGTPVTAGFYFAGVPGRRLAGTWNVGELSRYAEFIVKFEAPRPYPYLSPVWGGEVLVIEGIMLSPEGQPTLVKVPICYPGHVFEGKVEECETIRYGEREDLATPYLLGIHDLRLPDFLDLLVEKRFAYVIARYGLDESKVPRQYGDSPVYQVYRHYEQVDALRFLEYRGMPSPYVMPDVILSYELYGVRD